MLISSDRVLYMNLSWMKSKMVCFNFVTLALCFLLVSGVTCDGGERIEVDGDAGGVFSSSEEAAGHRPQQRFARTTKYTIEELQSTKFPLKYSGDIDLDPCKAGSFMGDIAIPNVNYEQSWEADRLNKTLQQEVERLKQEVLLEGLQVEEEGLTDIIRKRTKQPPPETDNTKSNSYNDPTFGIKDFIDSKSVISFTNEKSNQELNHHYAINVQNANTNSESNNINVSHESTTEKSSTTTSQSPTTSEQSRILESLEQDGILIVNMSTSNIITSDTIFNIAKPRIEKTQIKDEDLEEKKGKIQSNSREITGDGNGNIHKAKESAARVLEEERGGGSTEKNNLGSSTEPGQARIRNKHRKRRHGNKRKQKERPTIDDGRGNTPTLESSTENKNVEETIKYTRHNLRHGTRVGPYYSRLLKLQEELNKEDDAGEPKKPISVMMNYNGSVALEKKSKNAFRDDVEEEKWEPTYKKLDIPIHEFEESFLPMPKSKNLIFEDPKNETVTASTADVPFSRSTEMGEQNQTLYSNIFDNYGNFSWGDYKNTTDDPIEMQRYLENEDEQHGRRVARAATGRKERIWEHGVIPYEIDGNFSGAHKALFKQAMRHWENFTCVKFVERQPADHVNYIVFTERQCGCCSFVGKRGNGPQAISIGKNCDKFGIVVHELGHVVGFWHEHTRPDRDNHVQIIRDNIMAGQEYNFNKLTEEEVNSLGQGYDYDSIMHYARNTFSKGTYLDTILPLEVRGRKRPEIGQRVRLSESDIAQTNLLYKCHKCGRTLQENSGTFFSPSYNSPGLSAEGEKCEWRITATHGERIILNITDLDIYKSDNCQTDFLEVRDGYWQRSPVLGRFCGAGKAVPAVLSSGPRLLLHYVSTSRPHPHKGFTAYYEAVCGGELELDAGGHLESPNYPDDYQPNKECVWKLTVPQDYQVALKFQSFEVENHDNCVYDFVEVRDGHMADSPLVGVFCGYKIPPDIRSTSNKLLVKFVSDGSVQKAGFSATFMKEYDECALLQHGCQHDCINTLGGYECSCNIGYELHSDGKSCEDACGGVFDAPNGTITSPSFPDLYPAGKSCMWEIIAPPQFRIMLNFTHFELEGNNVYQQECEYDSLTVHSKLGAEVLRRHGVYCGSKIPVPVISEGNALRLMFTSDNSVQRSGFSAIYVTDNDECAVNNGGCHHECRNTIGSYVCSCHNGFMLDENKHDCKEGGCKYEVTQPQGTINSPNYPDQYPSRKDCVWHFTTTPGHRIKLLFNVFEMEHHQECAYDHIAVYDGDSPEATTLGRFCGTKSPHPIIANSNQMFMVFKSDASVQRKGFLATHTTACGGRLMATSRVKHLYSHARYGDENYEPRADCDWTIEAAPGRNVQLTFLTFNLEDEKFCRYDYVEVFNGPDASSGPSYGRFCGSSIPAEIISMSETLLIRFRSDETMVYKGFSASYYAVDPDPIDSEEMAVSRAVINNNRQQSKWNKPRSSRFHQPFMQRHLKPTDTHIHQRGHKYSTY